jgi:hypothetical protein
MLNRLLPIWFSYPLSFRNIFVIRNLRAKYIFHNIGNPIGYDEIPLWDGHGISIHYLTNLASTEHPHYGGSIPPLPSYNPDSIICIFLMFHVAKKYHSNSYRSLLNTDTQPTYHQSCSMCSAPIRIKKSYQAVSKSLVTCPYGLNQDREK